MTSQHRRPFSRPCSRRCATALGLLVAAASTFTLPAHADSVAAPPLAAHQQECAACHLAYPPGLLPASSWQRLMDNLPKHFGTDASVDAATQKQLSAWLASNAGTFKKVARNPAPPEDRISKSAWFVREHHEVAPAVWKRASVGSAGNCAACHTGAAQGRYSEHDVRIPK